MSERLLDVVRAIDAYAGAAGEPGVQPLGTVAIPLRLLQELRAALGATAK